MCEQTLLGGIELGGTKTVFAIGTVDGTILCRHSVATQNPAAVVADAATFFAESSYQIDALGVGAFGPIVVDANAECYGQLLNTNKPGWSNFDLIGALAEVIKLPTKLVTDVGAAAIAEARLGALKSCDIGIYLTVGTGIGGGIIANGSLLPALLHPEIGHITLNREAADWAPSTCQFHTNCAEGLAAGPAILARFGKTLSRFNAAEPEFALIAGYLGQLCSQLVMTLSPQRIVLGGGVSDTPELAAAVQAALVRHLGTYGPKELIGPGYICSPALGANAGVIGAMLSAAPNPLPSGRYDTIDRASVTCGSPEVLA
jgi:fructokinase